MPIESESYINRSIGVRINGNYLCDRHGRIRTYRTNQDAQQAAIKKGGVVAEVIRYS